MTELPTRLYLVTPRLRSAAELLPGLGAMLDAGDVACMLLRLEPASDRVAKEIVKAIAPLVQERGVALLVEDPRLAAHTGADGVHARGAGDDLSAALDSMKPERIVGAGGLADRDAAMLAGESGADYVMFGDDGAETSADGAALAADTLERVGWWVEIFNVPCVGMAHKLDEIPALARTGTEFVGLGEALWADPRGMAVVVAEATAILSGVAKAPTVPAEAK